MGLAKQMPRSRTYFRTTKQLEKQIVQAEKDIQKESEKQIDIIYHAAAIALYKEYDWRQLRIERFVKISDNTYTECAASNDLSMIQMLYDETGIELMRDDGNQHWYECIYLNSEIDDGKPLNPYQWLAMRQSQRKWVAAQITASILIALHRKEGWGVERCRRFVEHLEDIKMDYDYDPEKLKQASEKMTGFKLIEDFEILEKDR